jgi:leucyl-tRNA synthetase
LARYGADTLRLFILFTAPPERDLEWSEAAIEGAWRFLNRVWSLTLRVCSAEATQTELSSHPAPSSLPEGQLGLRSLSEADRILQQKIHATIAKVGADIEKFQYNTMVAACMELTNALQAADMATQPALVREGTAALLRLLNPACPHMTEELWQMLHSNIEHRTFEHSPLYAAAWPTFDAALAQAEDITLVVQIDGKVRTRLVVPHSISKEEALIAATATPEVQQWLAGRALAKEIYVPGRLVNLVGA